MQAAGNFPAVLLAVHEALFRKLGITDILDLVAVALHKLV